MFHRSLVWGSLGLMLAACAQLPTGIGGTPQPVTFTVTASAEAFSDREPVTLRVYDAEQLAIAEQTAGCVASMDSSGKETITCPPGVTYRTPTPEQTTVPRVQLAQGIVFASKTVVTGERYRVTLGGKAADNCNSAGAVAEGTASSAAVMLKDLPVAQTMMACQSPPPNQARP